MTRTRWATTTPLVLLLVAACSSSSTPSAHGTPDAGPTSAASATPTAAPASAVPGSSTTPPRHEPCATRDLQIKAGPAQGAAGSTYTTLLVTNISAVACTLDGYPGVALAGGTPVTQIGVAADRTPGTPPTLVTLAPHGAAHVVVRVANAADYAPATCQPRSAQYLQVYLPRQTTPTYVAFVVQGCAKPVHLLTTGPVLAGAT